MGIRLRIALAQINTCVGDLEGNLEKIKEFIKMACEKNPHIIIFPELTITGYPPEDLLLKGHFIDDNLKALNDIKNYVKEIPAIVGFVDRDKKGKIFNAGAVIQNGEVKEIYHKRYLPNYGVFDEKRYFSSGRKKGIFSLNGIIFGLNICEDIWIDSGPALEQVKKGAQIILNISASPFYAGKLNERKEMLLRRWREVKVPLCYVNLVGGQDELVFDGGSMVISDEKIIALGKRFEEDLVICDLEIERKKSVSRDIVYLEDVPERERGKVHPAFYKEMEIVEEIYNALVLGTRDYARKNGFKKVILGLSGGIDSSLTAVIAKEAMGSENVIGVSMPSRFSSEETKRDAEIIAKNLEINFLTIPIDSIFNSYLETLKPVFKDLPWDEAEENIQARIRGNILMALSNKFGYLLLSTGNKSELAVGYCTLYGDMAGGFAVLKDVPKTTVYELAHYVNRIYRREIIPESIIKRPPTAELRPGQTDEGTLGPYSVLDKIIHAYVEENLSLSQIMALSYTDNEKMVKETISRIDRSEYKRRQSPPGVKITPLSFGKDRRMPITNRYKLKE